MLKTDTLLSNTDQYLPNWFELMVLNFLQRDHQANLCNLSDTRLPSLDTAWDKNLKPEQVLWAGILVIVAFKTVEVECFQLQISDKIYRCRLQIQPYQGQWLWRSWQSSCFRHQRSMVRIKLLANFYIEHLFTVKVSTVLKRRK